MFEVLIHIFLLIDIQIKEFMVQSMLPTPDYNPQRLK